MLAYIRALASHLATAVTLWRSTASAGFPVFVDLLADGRRRCYFESPRTRYSMAYVDVAGLCGAELVVQPTDADFLSLTLAGRGGRLMRCFDAPPFPARFRFVRGATGVDDPGVVDVSEVRGFAQLMVRRFFNGDDLYERPELPPHPVLVATPGATPYAPGIAARARATLSFLLGRFVLTSACTLGALLLRPGRFRVFQPRDDDATTRLFALTDYVFYSCRYALPRGGRICIELSAAGVSFFELTVNNVAGQGVRLPREACSIGGAGLTPANGRWKVFLQAEAGGPGTLALGGARRGWLMVRVRPAGGRLEPPSYTLERG